MITSNNVVLPEEGTTKEYIRDDVGGWMFVVTKTTTIEQKNLQEFQNHIEDLQNTIASLQAELDAAAPQATALSEAVKAQSTP